MISIALRSAISYFLTYGGNWLLGTSMLERPIVVGAVTGILLGDLGLGLVMGAALEAIFMGAVTIGGQISADPAAATVFAVAFASQQSIDPEAALTLAVPIGILLGFVLMFVNNIFLTFLTPVIDKAAQNGNAKLLCGPLNYGVWFLKNIFFSSIIFLGVYAGHNAVEAFVDSIPAVLMTGLTVAGQFLPAVGLALLMKMLWSTENSIYYLLGFILAMYLELPLIAIALLGAILVAAVSLRDIEMNKLTQKDVSAVTSSTNENADVEDFFE
ncbi:PTS sugar transporter subunit IIC [Enterococcus casseliflavus]|uniref:PTS sugar transporter subunit IIC n=1 Tax=Enterococcus casseliflavus TaxID=37734 RepID=UPI0035D8AEE0